MMAVIAQFMLHVKQNCNTADHTDSEAGNVDERVGPVFKQISECDFEVVFEHRFSPLAEHGKGSREMEERRSPSQSPHIHGAFGKSIPSCLHPVFSPLSCFIRAVKLPRDSPRLSGKSFVIPVIAQLAWMKRTIRIKQAFPNDKPSALIRE
jgi:hypothetical protein